MVEINAHKARFRRRRRGSKPRREEPKEVISRSIIQPNAKVSPPPPLSPLTRPHIRIQSTTNTTDGLQTTASNAEAGATSSITTSNHRMIQTDGWMGG